MKSSILIFVLIIAECFNCASQYGITKYTPKGTQLTVYTNMPYMSDEEKAEWSNWVIYTYPQATLVGQATYDYNCHGWAWHWSEGDEPVWIGLEPYDPNPEIIEDVYWNDGSYIETTEPYASKISYYSGNHSAIQTSTQGVYISKWSSGPLVQHARDYGPSGYQMSNRKYYKLNPGISGNSTPLCEGQQRTFNSDISIPGSTYSWWRDEEDLNYVSGGGTTNYRVEAKNDVSGSGWVRLQIITPSGEIATTPYKTFWAGIPDIPVTLPSGPEIEKNYDEYFSITIYDSPGADPYSGLASATGSVEIIQPYGRYPEFHCYDYEWGAIEITTENVCGVSDVKDIYVYVPPEEKNAGNDEFIINLSPNPATSFVDIIMKNNKFDYLFRDYSIEFIDSYSRIVKSFKLTGQYNRIEIQDLPPGYYFIRLIIDNKIYQKTIIKQN